jgi:tetratricopeptide (TPR) repeat protein
VVKQWISIWAMAALAAGCTMPASPRIAEQAPVQLLPENVTGIPAPQKKEAGFTTRLVQYMTPGSQSTETQSATVRPANDQLDPISLGYASGPPSAGLYLSMAQMSDRGGNVDHARSMYQRALSIDARNREAMLGLARLEDREGNLDQAIHIYRQAMALNPQDAKVFNDLALCHARKNELSLSASALETAIRLNPQKQLYRNNIAKVLVEMNYIDPALSHLSAVHSPAVAQYNLGVLLHQRGRSNEAARFLENASRLDPQLAAANELLAQIKSPVTPAPASNDHILPTPQTPSRFAAGMGYPSTGAVPVTIPPQTARMPVGNSPIMLPAVR